ncbi:permease [Sphingomonas sp. PP-CC-1A-547]|uniref:cell division protein FtsX n=1 Tax=unclassified Sphingomonas TaxID=196159 RepID=UPI000FF115A7|nr:permease [Sphingomonas sp. PP-CC-1A-547]RKE47537.1 cell division transport system permease protein [Sphingomonas sp. PP-CC-1A-547]TCM07268.1 cell division transport system permease protein [Sphingomonas sp. PP-CC-3G-468]
MMSRGTKARSSAERRVLDEAGGLRAMTWVMAIMLFLTMLAAALGLATAGAARLLDRQLVGRLTVQVVDGDPIRRNAVAARVLAALKTMPAVATATPVDRAELTRLLQPWLGSDGADPQLPVPAMIDVDLANQDKSAATRVATSVRRLSPIVRVDRHESWMSPVNDVMRSLTFLALALVLLMASATAAVVVLAARAGLETHRETIAVMHILGSTDLQVARLFQRRIALDATIGGLGGGVAALLVVAFVGIRLHGLGSELLGGVTLGGVDWVALAILPIAFVVLATLAARVTIVRALRHIL